MGQCELECSSLTDGLGTPQRGVIGLYARYLTGTGDEIDDILMRDICQADWLSSWAWSIGTGVGSRAFSSGIFSRPFFHQPARNRTQHNTKHSADHGANQKKSSTEAF